MVYERRQYALSIAAIIDAVIHANIIDIKLNVKIHYESAEVVMLLKSGYPISHQRHVH